MLKTTQKGIVLPLLLLALIIVAVVGGGYYLSKNSSLGFNFTPPVPLNSHQELEGAVNKTVTVKTAHLDYKTNVKSHITVISTGVTQTLDNNVDGYLAGSDEASKGELKIYSTQNPSSSVVIDVISLKDGGSYVKGPATAGKWRYVSKEENNKLDEKNPTDASLYGFNLLDSVISDNKALFRTFKKETVEKLEDFSADGKTLKRFSVEIAVPDFVGAIEKDPDSTLKDKNDAKAILADATIKATFYVDKNTNYITKLSVSAKNLTQILTPEAKQLGVSTRHDIELSADISRFDLPMEIKAPDPSEVINPPSSI